MPYLVFLAGVIIAVFAFLKFFTQSKPQDIKRIFLLMFLAVYALIMVEFSMTGRLVMAIGMLLALVPFVITYYRKKLQKPNVLPPPDKLD